MRQKTADSIRNKVITAYNSIAEQFDKTRQSDWPEFGYFRHFIKKGYSVLDLGCGNGRLYRFLKKDGIKYTGLDNSQNLISKAQEDFPEANFILCDMSSINTQDEAFDTVISVASFHHLPGKELRKKTISEIHRVLKPGGTAIIMVWNLFQAKYIKEILSSITSFILTLGLKYSWNDLWIKWGDNQIKRYYHAFLPSELARYFKSNKWKIKEICFFRKGDSVKFWRSFNICITAEKK